MGEDEGVQKHEILSIREKKKQRTVHHAKQMMRNEKFWEMGDGTHTCSKWEGHRE